ncbi:MAG: sigma-70 family RNA polymerase sigma factor [Gemmatimonadota bacterium]|jgi:RNA polymerase sigma-70 factor (ECF subfamily)|nr:sigma-70 family RNA polymerase sigma factor [Gemmatimonadota bacterium]
MSRPLRQSSQPAVPREVLEDLDDATLVRRYLAGTERAFAVLVTRYQSRLLNFIARTIGDRDRAEDLVQEAFIRVARHLHRFDDTKKFSTWIYTIASNLAKNELRNRARSPLVLFQALTGGRDADEDRPLEFEDKSDTPDVQLERREMRAVVDAAVSRLPKHHREVFVLRELEGRPYEEIAEITRTNLGTVKSRLNRARASFAGLVGPVLD